LIDQDGEQAGIVSIQQALHELDNLPFDTTALRALAKFIVNRKS